MYASLRGAIVRGPVVGSEQAFVLVEDWLGSQPPLDRGEALAMLARRYLAGHGPATSRDLAKWAGLPLRDARAGVSAIEDDLVEGPDGTLACGVFDEVADAPSPRLLGAFEPLLLGWESREPVVGHLAPGLITNNGVFRAFALVGGRAAATWRLDRGRVVIEPLVRIDARTRAALDAEAEEVLRFLGG